MTKRDDMIEKLNKRADDEIIILHNGRGPNSYCVLATCSKQRAHGEQGKIRNIGPVWNDQFPPRAGWFVSAVEAVDTALDLVGGDALRVRVAKYNEETDEFE